jgi:hypothetical protein
MGFEAFASKICEASYTLRPESFSGATIVLPENAVALSPKVFAGGGYTIEDTTLVQKQVPPSIFFIIDHSGSMINGNEYYVGAQDQWGSRFSVTRDLIDTIGKLFPDKVEVGMAVFRNDLYFDYRNNDIFTGHRKVLWVPPRYCVSSYTICKAMSDRLG